MTTTLWGDLETYSDVPIKHGTYKYAENSEVMIFAYAIDDGPAQVWDLTTGAPMPDDLACAIYDLEAEFTFHNSMFDRSVLRLSRNLRLEIPIPRWRDTMVRAMAHSLPGALDKLCEIMNVDQDERKQQEGKQLIHLFCKPRPKNSNLQRATRETHPAEWARFVDYAKSDIYAMRAIARKMPRWNYHGDELALWWLDQRINDRGVCVDTELAHAAIRAVQRQQKQLAARTVELTNGAVEKTTQRDKLLKHLLAEYGVDLPDLTSSTLERRIADENLPSALRELLAIRLEASKSSVSKYNSVIRGKSNDDRIRGTLQFAGAGRTARWAGRVLQPQNMVRPAKHLKKIINAAIEALKHDCEDLLFPDVMALTAAAIRGVIIAPQGKKLCVSDLSNIEGRKLAWLAGEEWKLKAFADYDTITGHDDKGEPIRKGHDLYNLAYAKSFGVKPESVDPEQRQVGKVQELALGYEGGVGAFVTFAELYRIDLEAMAANALATLPEWARDKSEYAWEWAVKFTRTLGLPHDVWVTCDAFKRMWRAAHPEVCSLWRDLENAARDAIRHPGVNFKVRKLNVRRDANWLRIFLPSGRSLCYPSPQIIETRREPCELCRADDPKCFLCGGVGYTGENKSSITYLGANQYTRKWQRIHTYGGKLVENVTQASARDVLAAAMPKVEEAGYEIVLTVHDEIIAEAPDTDDFSAAHLSKLLSTNPPWAAGLPLAAGGFETYRYRKE